MKKPVLSPLVQQAVEFTEAYKSHLNDHIAIREAECLKAQYPAIIRDLRPEDTFAGRKPLDMIVYFGTIWWHAYPEWRKGAKVEGKQGGYCVNFSAEDKYAKTGEEKKAPADILDFWEKECSLSKTRKIWSHELKTSFLGNASVGFCMAFDFDRLLQRGIPGLIEDINARKLQLKEKGGDKEFLDGLLIMLDVFKDTCRHYEQQASELAKKAKRPQDKKGSKRQLQLSPQSPLGPRNHSARRSSCSGFTSCSEAANISNPADLISTWVIFMSMISNGV